jgi:RNA 2',3'-cyclic 3'-phosphodiesterase
MPRLFTALELPDDLRAELSRLHAPLPGARWLDPENYHVTLRFAGDIQGPEAREFAGNLAAIDADVFEVRIAGLGAFGGKDPSSVFAQLAPSPALDSLARAHEKAARNAGLAPDTRAFKPHVTLARLRSTDVEALARYLTRFGGYRSEPFFVSHFALMSSKPGVGGGPYGIEEIFPLRGGAAMLDEADTIW